MSGLNRFAYYGDTIRLYETPQQWLLGRPHGVCVLLWTAPLDYLFDGVGAVECDSYELQQRFVNDQIGADIPVRLC